MKNNEILLLPNPPKKTEVEAELNKLAVDVRQRTKEAMKRGS